MSAHDDAGDAGRRGGARRDLAGRHPSGCRDGGAVLSTTTTVRYDEQVVRVLADPLRAAIVKALANERLCTCHLVDVTGAGQSNVSNHLRVLREAGIVEAEPAGRYTYYRLRPEVFEALAAQLGDIAAQARNAEAVRRPCE